MGMSEFYGPRDDAEAIATIEDEMKQLDAAFPPGAAAGLRYPEAMMQAVNR